MVKFQSKPRWSLQIVILFQNHSGRIVKLRIIDMVLTLTLTYQVGITNILYSFLKAHKLTYNKSYQIIFVPFNFVRVHVYRVQIVQCLSMV